MSRRTVVVALALAVALAVAGLFAAGVAPDGTPLSDGSDADSSGVDDGSSASGEADGADSTAASDPDAGSEPEDEEPREEREGESSSEQSTEEESDETSKDDTDEASGAVETADVPVEIYAVDRGPIEDGEMRLYNTTSGDRVATHDFSEGHETVFENLTRTTTFDIEVNVSYYPDETVTFNPRISEEVNETIGYEFRGAETYEMEWEVDELPTNVDYDDEDAERQAITQKGYSVFDGEGNYYSSWSPPMFDASYDYLHVAANNQSYMNAAVDDAEWHQIEAYWGDPSTSREIITRSGLSDLHEREFIREKDVISTERNEVHVYRVRAPQTGSPLTVHIDPKTGYVVYVEVHANKINDPGFLRDVSGISSHDEKLDAIPEDFPVEKINVSSESQ